MTPLRLVSDRRLVEACAIGAPELVDVSDPTGPARFSTFKRRGSGFRPCTAAQREAVRGWRCIHCGGESGVQKCDPAHLTPAPIGCDDVLCIVPLCRICHDGLDGRSNHPVDLAPILALEEWARHRAHMAGHMDFITCLQRLSGCKYAPVNETTLMGAPLQGGPEGTAA